MSQATIDVDIQPQENRDYAAIEIKRWSKFIKRKEKCLMPFKRYYKVKKVTDVDRILHRVNIKNSVHYLTVGKHGEESKSSKELPKAFIAPGGEDFDVDITEMKIQRDATKEYVNKDINCATDIRDRIYVPESRKKPLKDITDIDDNDFSTLAKEELKLKLEMRSYLDYLRESLRLHLQTGYVLDEVLKLNEQADVEKHKMRQIEVNLKSFSASFKEFLDKDHEKSMKPTLNYMDYASAIDKCRIILKQTNTEVVKLKFNMYELEDAFRKCQICEKFVFSFFSILSGNESTYYYNLKYGSDDSSNSSTAVDETESISSFIRFESPNANKNEFELDLSDPSYLLEVFRSLEHQCLDYLTFIELLEKQNKSISDNLSAINSIYKFEISSVKQSISGLENLIMMIERNNAHLKGRVNELLYGVFKETFPGAVDSLTVNEYINQTYSSCISGSFVCASSTQMLHEIGLEYQRILLEMDSLPTGYLTEFVKNVKNRKQAKLVLARQTRRRLRELEGINEQMSRIFRPTLIRKTRKLVPRSEPPTKKLPPPRKPKEITEDEKKYLYLFTKFCKFTDDANVYLSKIQNKKL